MNISKITITELNKTITKPSNSEVSKILHKNIIPDTDIKEIMDKNKTISQMLQDQKAEILINSMRTNALRMQSHILNLII